MFFQRFDRIRVINLTHRRDRRATMFKELAAVGLADDSRVAFFPAWTSLEKGSFYSAGARGCFLSHLAVLEEAEQARESVLILEDDCDFTSHIKGFDLPVDWDVFYGGVGAASDPTQLHVSDIVGAHCMGFSVAVVKRLVPRLHAAFEGDDPAAIDGEYVRFRRANPDLSTIFAQPQVAVQRPSRTDIGTLRAFDRLIGLRSGVELARRAKHWIVRRRER